MRDGTDALVSIVQNKQCRVFAKLSIWKGKLRLFFLLVLHVCLQHPSIKLRKRAFVFAKYFECFPKDLYADNISVNKAKLKLATIIQNGH